MKFLFVKLWSQFLVYVFDKCQWLDRLRTQEIQPRPDQARRQRDVPHRHYLRHHEVAALLVFLTFAPIMKRKTSTRSQKGRA